MELDKRSRILMILAVIFLLLTAAVHSISLFVTQTGENETERQLLAMMNDYKLDLGGGFHRSMNELTTALSSCFTFLCVLGALTVMCLLRKGTPSSVVRPVLGVHALVFGICFLVMIRFTFLPPIVLSGLNFLFLSLAYLVTPKAAVTE